MTGLLYMSTVLRAYKNVPFIQDTCSMYLGTFSENFLLTDQKFSVLLFSENVRFVFPYVRNTSLHAQNFTCTHHVYTWMTQKRLDAIFYFILFFAKVRANAFSVQTSMNIVCVCEGIYFIRYYNRFKGCECFYYTSSTSKIPLPPFSTQSPVFFSKQKWVPSRTTFITKFVLYKYQNSKIHKMKMHLRMVRRSSYFMYVCLAFSK